jgi:hypothetical protein
LSSDEDLFTSTEEMPQNEQRELIVSEGEHDRLNCVGEVLLSEEPEETKTSSDALRPEFAASEQKSQKSGDLVLDAPILLLIVRGLCHRVCRKDLFGPYPRRKAEIKNISALLTHLDKKHELADVYCKDLMRHFTHDLYPGRIDIVLKTGDGVTVDKLWDVEKCPCLGCDYFHSRHHNSEIYAKLHKEMSTNTEALGWFWRSIRTKLQNNQRTTI